MVELYADRWSIEQMFSHWKKREALTLNPPISLTPSAWIGLMGLPALAVHQWESRLNNNLAIKRKKHGSLAKSIFRYGLDHFMHAMRRITQAAQRTTTDILKPIFTNASFVR